MRLGTNENGIRSIRIIGLIILFSGIALGSYLNRPDNYTRRQVRTVICAKEMMASGNYIIPTLSGATRFRKPPLPYWLISLTSKLDHNQITNVTSRLPSVVAGILVLLLTWWWAFQLNPDGNQKKALLSPLLLAFVPLFYMEVRSSEAEIELCLFIMAASYFFWKAAKATETSGKNLIFAYLFVAGGFLIKGPIAWIMPLIPYAVIRKKAFIKEWKWHVLGFIIAIIPVGLWVLAVYIYYPGAIHIFIKELFIRRFGEEAKHAGPFFYYMVLLLGQFAVFVPVIVIAFCKGCAETRETHSSLYSAVLNFIRSSLKRVFINRDTGFLIYFIILNLIWLSAMASKQRHYIIPLLPPISIVLGLWLSEKTDSRWVNRYFYVIAVALGAGMVLFGWTLIPLSIPILATGILVAGLIAFYSRHFILRGVWFIAVFFLALMQLADLFVGLSGNRLLYEKLMASWTRNQPVIKERVVVVDKPKEVLAFYLDAMNQYIYPKDDLMTDKADYYIVEEDKKLFQRFIADKRFYVVKSLVKIRKKKRRTNIMLFGKIDNAKTDPFEFKLLFLSGDEKDEGPEAWVGKSFDTDSLYAIVPEMNPLIDESFFSIGNRMKFNERYLPILDQGVELICKLDPRSSIFRRAWFNDVSYWGVTPDNLQRRSFFNGQYSLWIVDAEDIEASMPTLEQELSASRSEEKFVFFQRSSSNRAEISLKYVERLKKMEATIINDLITGEAKAAEIKIGYDHVEIKRMGSNGKLIAGQPQQR